MRWFTKQPLPGTSFEQLTESNNQKYGNYDYGNDSRILDQKFNEILIASVGNLDGKKVLVCGANSGYEIDVLSLVFPSTHFTATDISSEALNLLSLKLPQTQICHTNMEELPFEDRQFDLYLNCRAIHSSNVDITNALDEAVRVSRGKIVISIANGYVVKDKIVNGMYDYFKKEIDIKKPFKVLRDIKGYFNSSEYKIDELFSDAEIILTIEPL